MVILANFLDFAFFRGPFLSTFSYNFNWGGATVVVSAVSMLTLCSSAVHWVRVCIRMFVFF